MNKTSFVFAFITVIFLSACSSSRNSNIKEITGTTWELEYLAGTTLSFKELFPQKNPQLTFEKESKTVLGNDGCNGYNAPFLVEGKKLSFGEPGPSTLMYCGEGEAFFRKNMKKIDGYKMDEGKLVLLSGDEEMLRFHKIIQ